jgi:putative transcriptional regulator
VKAADTEITDLTGSLLIAAPRLRDPNFDRTVVFLCQHSEEGAMGLVVNRMRPEIDFRQLLDSLGIVWATAGELAVHYGGPVDPGRGFVLHSDECQYQATAPISEGIALTASRDILGELAVGKGPRQSLFALGYSGWAPGQLEGEIAADSWLIAPGDHDVLFDLPMDERWNAAAQHLGIDLRFLGRPGGKA